MVDCSIFELFYKPVFSYTPTQKIGRSGCDIAVFTKSVTITPHFMPSLANLNVIDYIFLNALSRVKSMPRSLILQVNTGKPAKIELGTSAFF